MVEWTGEDKDLGVLVNGQQKSCNSVCWLVTEANLKKLKAVYKPGVLQANNLSGTI